MNVRLNAKAARALAALASRRQQSRSDVVREALEYYAASHEADAGGGSPCCLADGVTCVQNVVIALI